MKNDPNYKQKGRRLGSAGGFFNQLMSHNSSVPVVGEGATELLYSDRHAYEVLEVNEKEKSCTIQRYAPKRIDNLGMSDSQAYEYKELTGTPFKLYWRYGSWKRKMIEYHWILGKNEWPTQEMSDEYKAKGGKYNGAFLASEIPGITKKKTRWYTMSIIFGVKREYYDFSF